MQNPRSALALAAWLRYVATMARRRRSLADDDVPRLPRGRGLHLSLAQIVRIAMVAVALVALIVLQKPCARSMGRFVAYFGQVDAGVVRVDAPAAPVEGVMLRGSMTPAELEAAIAREREAASGRALDAGLDGGAADAGAADGGR